MILCTLEHDVRDIRSRDRKPETRQMILSQAIRSRVGFVGESGWPNDGPVQPAVCEYMLHLRRICHQVREEQSAGQISRRDDLVLEQECHRDGNDALDSGVKHRTGECVCEVL